MIDEFRAYAVGLLSASVCSSLSVKETTTRLNEEHLTGISSRWELSEDEYFACDTVKNGGPCDENPETHKHYLFNC